MADLSDHRDRGGFCECCGTLWPCAAMRTAFLAQRAAPDGLAQRAAPDGLAQRAAPDVVARVEAPELLAQAAAPEVLAQAAVHDVLGADDTRGWWFADPE